ncbi:MAG: hypothetical protein KHX56_04395 [Clostridiales bacterium]|nr:hypothetical protein [Clostridiales bacterium]
MIDKTPLLNGMSVKERAKYYDSLSAPKTPEVTSMKKRKSGYVGMPLAKQSQDHKAPALTRRGKSYTFQASAKTDNSMKKRGRKYQASPKDLYPYAVNSQFSLKIGDYIIKCSRISNLSMASEIEEVPEGGNSLYPNIFTGASKKADVLVIERAFVEDRVAGAFKPGVYVGESTISVMRNGEVYKELGFDEGMVTKCEFSDLDAMGNEVMIQKIEIAHTGLYTW